MIDFEKLIDQYLHRERRPKQIGRYYPSEAGYCMRKVWYTYKQPKETEKDLIRIFHLGNLLHDFVVNVFQSEKNPDVELIQAEMPFKLEQQEFTVSGRIDDVVMLKENSLKILVEVKSCRSVDAVDEPQNSHKMQIQLYMHAMGVHDGVILYIEKSSLKSKSFTIKYDGDWAKRIIDRFDLLDRHLKKDVIPAAEGKNIPAMSYMCAHCEYAEECQRDGNEEGGALSEQKAEMKSEVEMNSSEEKKGTETYVTASQNNPQSKRTNLMDFA